MDKELIMTAICKVFDREDLNEKELFELKDFLYSGIFLVDISDDQKRKISEATVDNIHEICRESMLVTIERIFKMRYGL